MEESIIHNKVKAQCSLFTYKNNIVFCLLRISHYRVRFTVLEHERVVLIVAIVTVSRAVTQTNSHVHAFERFSHITKRE